MNTIDYSQFTKPPSERFSRIDSLAMLVGEGLPLRAQVLRRDVEFEPLPRNLATALGDIARSIWIYDDADETKLLMRGFMRDSHEQLRESLMPTPTKSLRVSDLPTNALVPLPYRWFPPPYMRSPLFNSIPLTSDSGLSRYIEQKFGEGAATPLRFESNADTQHFMQSDMNVYGRSPLEAILLSELAKIEDETLLNGDGFMSYLTRVTHRPRFDNSVRFRQISKDEPKSQEHINMPFPPAMPVRSPEQIQRALDDIDELNAPLKKQEGQEYNRIVVTGEPSADELDKSIDNWREILSREPVGRIAMIGPIDISTKIERIPSPTDEMIAELSAKPNMLSMDYNEHWSYYENPEDSYAMQEEQRQDWVSESERARALELNRIFRVYWHYKTPVGHVEFYASELDIALQACIDFKRRENY